jgi:phosphatidylinositol glycan class O
VDFNREIPNVRGFFEYIHDQEMSEEMWQIMRDGDAPKLTIYHITGLDGFLHNSGNPNRPFVHQGVQFLDNLIPDLIDAMDDETTLILMGDHGFGDDCDHGGDTLVELATGMFFYQKTGFPMKKWYDEHPEKFNKIDGLLKNVDVASIVSLVLDTAFPFSNFGTLHPVLSPSADINYLHDKMVANVNQMSNYIKTYCDLRGKYWCPGLKQY